MRKRTASSILIGLALLFLGGILLYQLFDMPPVYPTKEVPAFQTESTSTQPLQLNLNTASVDELTAIDGIGDTKATAIVSYREENGPFLRVDDLIYVNGIGEATLEHVRPFLYVKSE